MRNIDAAINAKLGKVWTIGGAPMPCRYRYQGTTKDLDDTHTIKTTAEIAKILPVGTVCIDPDGEKFEVISSKRVAATTYQHTLQIFNDKPQTDWTPSR